MKFCEFQHKKWKLPFVIHTKQHPGTLKRSKQSLGEYVLDPSLVFVCGCVWKGVENWAVSLSKEEELIWWKVETYHVASDIYLFRVKVRNTKELKRLKIWAKWVSCSSFCVVDVKSIWKKIVLCQIIVFSIYFILLRSLLGHNSHIMKVLFCLHSCKRYYKVIFFLNRLRLYTCFIQLPCSCEVHQLAKFVSKLQKIWGHVCKLISF